MQKIESPVQKNWKQKKEKTVNEKALGAYNNQYKQRCCKCGKYSHKSGNCKCPENKNEKDEKNKKMEKNEDENKKFNGVEKGIWVGTAEKEKMAIIKKWEGRKSHWWWWGPFSIIFANNGK